MYVSSNELGKTVRLARA